MAKPLYDVESLDTQTVKFTVRPLPTFGTFRKVLRGLVLVILFQPGGLNGIWLKSKVWFQAFPFKRQTSFRSQKSYAKSERLR